MDGYFDKFSISMMSLVQAGLAKSRANRKHINKNTNGQSNQSLQ